MQFPSRFFSIHFICVHIVHPYSSIDTIAARKNSCFILSDRSDFHMFGRLLIAVHVFARENPRETTAVWPLTSHLQNHPNKTNKKCGTLLKKQERTHKWRSPMDHFLCTCQCWPTNKNFPSTALSGKRWNVEDLQGVIDDRDGWRERVHLRNPC